MLSKQVSGLEKENEALKYENELLKKRLEANPEKKPKMCKECKFFIQHYGKYGNRYHEINAGHCVAGRTVKSRPAENAICEYFEFGNYELTCLEREAKVNGNII